MVTTQLALRIIETFLEDLYEPKTIRQIALATKKAYANVYAGTTALIGQGVLEAKRIGHSTSCTINLQNEQTCALLCLVCAKNETPQSRQLRKNRALFAFTHNGAIIAIAHEPTSIPGIECITPKAFLESPHAAHAGAHLLFGAISYVQLLQQVRK
jgi:hypothetical protein